MGSNPHCCTSSSSRDRCTQVVTISQNQRNTKTHSIHFTVMCAQLVNKFVCKCGMFMCSTRLFLPGMCENVINVHFCYREDVVVEIAHRSSSAASVQTVSRRAIETITANDWQTVVVASGASAVDRASSAADNLIYLPARMGVNCIHSKWSSRI